MTNNLLKLLIFIILIFGLTLPFHWVLSEPIVIPKKTLSLNETFITRDEVSMIVERFYFGSPKEKFETDNQPLTIELAKRWKVIKTDDGSLVFYHFNNIEIIKSKI